MARTKPKPFRADSRTSPQAKFYGRFAVGDLILLYAPNGPLVPALDLGYSSFYLITVTPEFYEKMKNASLDVTSASLTYNDLDFTIATSYWVIIRNARYVDSSRNTGSGGSPSASPVDATEGDGFVVFHKSAATNTTLGTTFAGYASLSNPSTGVQAWTLSRSGGTAGSYAIPSIAPLTQTGNWTVTCFYFESASDTEPISYSGPYLSGSRMLTNESAVRSTAVLPAQTEVGDLVFNIHASATGTSLPATPTNWTSLSRGTTSAPFYDAYYKYISNIDADDSFTTYNGDDVLYTTRIVNAGTGDFIAGGIAAVSVTNGTASAQPTINSMTNTQPYQLGFFAAIKKTEVPIDKTLLMSATNEWELDNSVQAYNAFTAGTRISLAVSTFDAVEEQVLPPSQMAYSNTLQASGTAYSEGYPSVALRFIVKNNQQ